MFTSIPKALHFLSKREKWIFFTLLIIRAFTGILDVIGIALIGLIAGLAATSFTPGQKLEFFGLAIPALDERTLILLVTGVLILFISKALIAILLARAIALFLAKIETEKSLEIVSDLFAKDLQKSNAISKGGILWAVTASVNVAFSAVLMSFTTIVSEGLLLILIAVTFAIVDPVATIYVFIYFGFVIFALQLVISKSLKKAGRDISAGSVESTTALEDLISSLRETKVLGKTSFFINRFYIARQKLSRANATMVFLNGMPRYVVETALIFGVVVFVGFQFLSGQFAQGFVIVGVFLTGGVRIMASLLPLQAAVANLKTQDEQAKFAFELLTQAEEAYGHSLSQKTKGDFEKLNSKGPIGVRINDLVYSYPDSGQPAISEVDLEITPGQHVAIIGPSGAGKTTLVDLLLGLINPDGGEISFYDQRGSTIELSELPGKVSYVPQKPGLISGTIAQNIALGVPASEIDEAKVQEAIYKADLQSYISALPEGIHTSVGEQSNALSGGQIQRLGLARALYEKPNLIVLDEATSALDASSEAAITKNLKNFGSDVTVIVIAHRLSTVQYSDNVFVIEEGKLTAEGNFSSLKKTVPMVAEYVRLMSFNDD